MVSGASKSVFDGPAAASADADFDQGENIKHVFNIDRDAPLQIRWDHILGSSLTRGSTSHWTRRVPFDYGVLQKLKHSSNPAKVSILLLILILFGFDRNS